MKQITEHHRIGLVGAGLGTVATACVPAVSSSIVVDDSQSPESGPREQRPKRASGPDRTPPTIVGAELVGNTKLRIHFSEPIVATAGFDPNDFRISMLRVTNNGSYSTAYYYEPGTQYYGVLLTHKAAHVEGDTLEIEFSSYLTQAFCRGLEYTESYGRRGSPSAAGLFLHYAAGPIPILDEGGNPVDSFGVSWVMGGREQPPQTQSSLSGDQAVAAGSKLVHVSCGPPIPPGPR